VHRSEDFSSEGQGFSSQRQARRQTKKEGKPEMKCALYSRVSTADQNVSMQLDELRAYCERRGLDVAEEYVDSAVSGAKESRPALNRLLADARHRKFDAVLVYRYDRFARSLRQLVTALGEFDALGIHFISLHEGVDTSTPSGRLVFGIFASIAEFERSLIAERVKSGQAAAKRRGVKFGRPKLELDTKKLTDLRSQGMSYANIAKATGLSLGTVYRVIGL
jgi:DNA invertase Pin-like site-specific DNA recombinase